MSLTTQDMTTPIGSPGEDLEWSKKAQTATRLINESIERLSEKNPSHANEARKWKGLIEREYDPIVKNLQAIEELGREKLKQYDAKLRQLQEREFLQGARYAQSTAKEQAAVLAANRANEEAARLTAIKKTIHSQSKELDAPKQRCVEFTNQCAVATNTGLDANDKSQSLEAQSKGLERVIAEEEGRLDQRKSDLYTFEQQLGTRELALTEAKTLLELQSQSLERQKEDFQRERQSFCDREAESRGLVTMAIEYKTLKDQAIEAIKSKVPRLERDNGRLQDEEKRLKASNGDLLSKTRELEDIVKTLNTESMNRAENIELLQDRLVKLEEASERARQTSKEEHTKLQAANQDLESFRKEHALLSQRLRTANQSLALCRCSNRQDRSLKRTHGQIQESETGGSSQSEPRRLRNHGEDDRESENAHMQVSGQQNDVHPDSRSLTDSTAPRRSLSVGPTIARSDGGEFSILVSEAERNNCTSDIIPDQVLAIIREQIGEWTNRDANWPKTGGPRRCVERRILHRYSTWANGAGYACSDCRTNGHVCSLLEKKGILRFLPLKTSGETTKAPDEVEYWVELSE